MKQRKQIFSGNAAITVVLIISIAYMSEMVWGSPLSGDGACHLKILTDEFNEWHDIAEGFVYGMY